MGNRLREGENILAKRKLCLVLFMLFFLKASALSLSAPAIHSLVQAEEDNNAGKRGFLKGFELLIGSLPGGFFMSRSHCGEP